MASRAPAATGRLLVSFRKWYYNAAGFNKIGLLRDDTIHEDGDVKEALRRLPEKDVHYLEPYLKEVIRERKEVEEWSKK
ncbi:unnamed protein product [Coregonus sp. 'balchen']|nr:unnamed protein product [Coregonus sp. 'balchen']